MLFANATISKSRTFSSKGKYVITEGQLESVVHTLSAANGAA